ncbi:hypothetical protein F5Y14DRAFT_365147 [Nemania sp. NC0429]|nr:hypothetical protein F5Y14DRAFT_365147 [Nemania sp. NC0429]
MKYSNFFTSLLCAAGAVAGAVPYDALAKHSLSSVHDPVSSLTPPDKPGPPSSLPRSPRSKNDRRDTYPINCHLHDWPSASVESIKEAYSWFYQLWAPFEADAQQCRRIACFGTSGVWMCADSLGYQNINSVTIADQMNNLLDGDHGCLDAGNKNMVQGQIFTSEAWNILVRGGEDCSIDVPEKPIFY